MSLNNPADGEPIYSETTERLYYRLPEIYRQEDQNQEFQFKTWLSGVVDRAGDIEVLVDRFKVYDSYGDTAGHETSDLFDPLLADEPWLDWLAMIFGIPIQDNLAVERKRARIDEYSMAPGSKAELQNVAGEALVGDKFVGVIPHYTDTGVGDEWDVLLVSKDEETLSNMLTRSEATGTSRDWTVRHYRRNRFPGPIVGTGTWTGAGTVSIGAVNGERLIPGLWYITITGAKTLPNLAVTSGVPHKVTYWVNPNGGTATLSIGGGSNIETGTGWRRASFSFTPSSSTVNAAFTSTFATSHWTAIMIEAGNRINVYFDPGYQELTGLTYQYLLSADHNSCLNPSFETDDSLWTETNGTLATSTHWSAGQGFKSGKYTITASSLTAGMSTIISPIRTHYEVRYALYSEENVAIIPWYRYRDPTLSAITYLDRVDIPNYQNTQAFFSIDLPVNTLEVEVGFYIRDFESDSTTPDLGSSVYIDNIMISPSDVLPLYFDGNSAGYKWTGTTNLSASATDFGVGITFTYGENEYQTDFYGDHPMAYTARDYGVIDIERDAGQFTVTSGVDFSMGARVAIDGTLVFPPTAYLVGKYASTQETADGADLSTDSVYLEGTTNEASVSFSPQVVAVDIAPGTKIYFGEVYARQGTLLGFVPETISLADYVIRANAKPAGIVLWHKTFTTTWDIIEAEIDDWNGLDELTWEQLEMLGLELT